MADSGEKKTKKPWTKRGGDKQEDGGYTGYFEAYEEGPPRLGWLLNFSATTVVSSTDGGELSGLELYLIDPRDRSGFKVVKAYRPYLYVAPSLRFAAHSRELGNMLGRRFEAEGNMRCAPVDLEDLDVPNHVTGIKRTYLKMTFDNVSALMNVKADLLPRIQQNRRREEAALNGGAGAYDDGTLPDDLMDTLTEIREYDVPYTMRCSIDLDIRVGAWLQVAPSDDGPIVEWKQDVLEKPEPRILAWDIECTKAPLKFPNAESDEIFMISYMVDGVGFLIISRTVVSEDIADFEYTPKPQFPGPFTIFNEADEVSLLKRFVSHVQELKPHIFVTYNGDYFDWPFVERRLDVYGMDLYKSFGVRQLNESGEYRGKSTIHLDSFYWVKRDSYLPQGSQGLKAVTKCKLGYDPVEVDPEDMVRCAFESPSDMAAYSVSDAVATYYLYEVYVNLFIFSLCTIIPNAPEDVLRKGSGTLCEALLMVQAYKAGVVCPNKQQEPLIAHHKGHMVESETYVGGHVESLETGVYRSDLPYDFKLEPAALQKLIDNVDRDLTFVAEVEGKVARSDIVNYDAVRDSIVERLEMLRDAPVRRETPAIYHLDVGAMYPNIILTNRLQPTAIVSRELCASCDYNDEANNCKRPLDWVWRGELNPAKASEFAQLKRQLQYERVGASAFHDLDPRDQAAVLRRRARDYSHKVYKKTKVTVEEPRRDVTCMRENAFYVDTVRAFRDRRYEYKGLTKRWKKQRVACEARADAGGAKKASDKELLFESLQVAHKCILNSFYGYVMRKGARWRSMPMAGIVTLTGASLITQARELVEAVGRPLELDTDGIWCMVPSSFPENYDLRTADGRSVPVHYACAMLNADVAANYTNHQHQALQVDEATENGGKKTFKTSSECSIFFEVDGPYRCMVLPASTEEGKLLKKRYAVFNHDGSLAELKGFELKRRGELEVIKIFQSEIFGQFLRGDSLQTCYAHVAAVANTWLDVLESRGRGMPDGELMELISENRTMSKEVGEYEGRKMTSLTTARRLADFLGDEMIKDKGLQCKLVISSLPAGAPVTDRAIPTAIFAADPAVRQHFLRKWLKSSSITGDDFRDILDWEYYRDRVVNVVRKIITIPAALQGVPNPVPRVQHPDWLKRLVRSRDDKRTQLKIDDIFQPSKVNLPAAAADADTTGKRRRKTAPSHQQDIEDFGGAAKKKTATTPHTQHSRVKTYARRSVVGAVFDDENNDDEAPSRTVTPTAGPPPTSPPSLLRPTEAGAPRRRAPQIREGFPEWIADRKRRWRDRRLARHHEVTPLKKKGAGPLLLLGTPGASTAHMPMDMNKKKKRPAGIGDMIRESGQALREGLWRVLEVRETAALGEFHVFLVSDLGHVHRVHLEVPRVFYAEMGTSAPLAVEQAIVRTGGRRVATHWHVPTADASAASPHQAGRSLYEVRVPERKVSGHASKDIAALLAHPDLEAAYELGTPLWFQALLKVGGAARVSKKNHQTDASGGSSSSARSSSSSSSDKNRFSLDEVELALDDAALVVEDLRVIYVHHSSCARTRRCVVAVFFLKGGATLVDRVSSGATAAVFVGDPAAAKKKASSSNNSNINTIKAPPLGKLFAERTGLDRASLRVDRSEVVRSAEEACGLASVAVAAYVAAKHGATVAVVESAVGVAAMRRLCPALGDVANVAIAADAADSFYPTLGWQLFAAQRAVEGCCRAPAWLADREALGRYGNLPLGNIGEAPLVRVADAAFARLLRANRHLLWASEAALPDLGRAFDTTAALKALGISGGGDDEASLFRDANAPGVYRTVCVEAEIFGLAVDAILVSEHLADDGVDAHRAPAFKLLRALVAGWVDDVAHRQSREADALLVALYSWLGARTSLLYAPHLRRQVRDLMRRVHLKLVNELRRLGLVIVHASLHKLVLATNKPTVEAANRHLHYVLETLAARPTFQYLSLRPTATYTSLVFVDAFNYGALETLPSTPTTPGSPDDDNDDRRLSNPASPSREDEGEDGHDADDDEEEEAEFEADNKPISHRRTSKRTINDDDDDDEEERGNNGAVSFPPAAAAPLTERFVSHWALASRLSDLGRDYFYVVVGAMLRQSPGPYSTERLLAITNELKRRRVAEGDLVHFVVLTCHVLGLDPALEREHTASRRTLLATIGLREFADKATLAPTVASCTLRDKICAACHACADVDLLNAIDPDEGQGQGQGQGKEVRCDHCRAAYDLLDLELELVDQFNDLTLRISAQDLHCAKCRKVATTTMSTMCDCSGQLKPDLADADFKVKLANLRTVALNYDMAILGEILATHEPSPAAT